MQKRNFVSLMLGLMAFCLLLGCSSAQSRAQVAPPAPTDAQKLLEEGKSWARQGQSVRAEEYLSAAWDHGIAAEEVAPHLIATCIEGGRLRSALFHVERLLRQRPFDAGAMQLAASLYLALGQEEVARQVILSMEELNPKMPPILFFLGEYLYEHGEAERARGYFMEYLKATPHAEEASWVRHLLSQMKQMAPVEPEPNASHTDQAVELVSERTTGGV